METERDIRIREALTYYQTALRLGDWDLRYSPTPIVPHGIETQAEVDDVLAQIDPSPSERIATVRLHPDLPDHQIEGSIAHELMHLVILEYENLVNGVLAKHGDSALGVMDTLDEYSERICSRVASALTGYLYEPVGPEMTAVHAPFVNHSVPKEIIL